MEQFASNFQKPDANAAASNQVVRSTVGLAPLLIESNTIYLARTQRNSAYKSIWCVGEVLLVFHLWISAEKIGLEDADKGSLSDVLCLRLICYTLMATIIRLIMHAENA